MSKVVGMDSLEGSFFAGLLEEMQLPKGWRLVAIGEALLETQYGLSEAVSNDGNVPIVGMRDVADGRVNLSGLATIRDNGDGWSAMRLRRGDILLNRTNSPDLVGKTGIVSEDSEAVFASYLVRLKVNTRMANPFFVNYWLNSSVARRALKRLSTRGVSQANINPTEFRRHFPIPLPPLVEQCKIVEILHTWDAVTKKLMALHAAKQVKFQAIVLALVFGSRRLTCHRDADETHQYRWFKLPETWGCQPIGKLAREVSERNVQDKGLEVLSCTKHDGFVRSLEYFNRRVYSTDLSNYKKIWRGDFGFPSNHIEEGSIGHQNLVDVGLVSPIYTVFRFNEDQVDPDYALAVLKTSVYRHIFEVSTSASVDRRGSLRWKDFAKLPFPVPPLEEQRAIADVVRTMKSELDMLDSKLEALTHQKRGLMQKLLTGEWRVSAEPVA